MHQVNIELHALIKYDVKWLRYFLDASTAFEMARGCSSLVMFLIWKLLTVGTISYRNPLPGMRRLLGGEYVCQWALSVRDPLRNNAVFR